LASEYEGYIRQIDPKEGHDPGLIFARIREAQAARRPQEATAQDGAAQTPAAAPEQSVAWPGWRRDTTEPMSMQRVREGWLPERDYTKMTDAELDAAEREIADEEKLIEEKMSYLRDRQNNAKEAHSARTGEAGKNVANAALDGIGRETFGQIVRGLAPRGIRGGIRSPAGEGAVVQSAKEGAQYWARENSLENMDEALTDLEKQRIEQHARLERLRKERAARQER
jgi:hypothetical protein